MTRSGLPSARGPTVSSLTLVAFCGRVQRSTVLTRPGSEGKGVKVEFSSIANQEFDIRFWSGTEISNVNSIMMVEARLSLSQLTQMFTTERKT